MFPAVLAVPAVVAVTALTSSTLLWYIKPGLLLKPLFRIFLYKSGLRLKYVTLGDQQYCIAEKGSRKVGSLSMVCIPGFSSTKDMWVPIAQKLPPDVHMVVIELPGHGGSSVPPPDCDISPPRIVQGIHEVMEHLGLADEPVHMVGTSLGGALTGLYAATYPDNVACITLMCPAFKTPIESDFMKEARQGTGNFALIPKTPESMQTMLNLCMHKSRPLSKQFLQGLLDLRMPRNDFYERFFSVLREEMDKDEDSLQEVLVTVKAPAHVIWGKEDQLVHLSGVDYLRKTLTNLQQVDLIDNCGHSLTMERPGLVVKNLLKFRGEFKLQNSSSAEPTNMNPKL